MRPIIDSFSIRYRKNRAIEEEWKNQRDEIEGFLEMATESLGIQYNYSLSHFPAYSEFEMEDEYELQNLGPSIALTDALIDEFPDVQFEYHFIGWYGGDIHSIVIYDGVKKYGHTLEIGATPENSEDDPYLDLEAWPADQVDENGFANPFFYFIKDSDEEPESLE